MNRLMMGAVLIGSSLLIGCAGYRDRNAFSIDLTDTGVVAPATLRVPLGASVTFRNAGIQPREVYYLPGNVTARQTRPAGAVELTPDTAQPADAQAWRSSTLYPGDTWTHDFEQSGAYLFQSPYAAGFSGTSSTQSDRYGNAQGQQSRFTNAPPLQVAAGVITVEAVKAGQPGDSASEQHLSIPNAPPEGSP